tara:strand:+ start:206 stop:601 length:396 start_codon:yes stop_codon:yes gene_type:complete
MSTRAQVRFATRETGQSFSEHPEKIHAQFYVHSDGYPEGLGLEIANSIASMTQKISGWEIEHVQDLHTDLDYIYYVWSDYDKDTWISIFAVGCRTETCEHCDQETAFEDECIFVGTPEKFIEKYSQTKNEL